MGVAGFLDAASGQPLHPAAREALIIATERGWADPDRMYHQARSARLLLETARESIAAVLGVPGPAVSFEAGLEPAMRRAVRGVLRGRQAHGRHLVISEVEHSALLHAAAEHEAAGGQVTRIGVDAVGRIDASACVSAAALPETAAVVLQAANHEVGTRQPVAEMAAQLIDVPLVMDAHQVLGREQVPPGWSVLVAGARQFGGPAGVGILAVRPGTRWQSPDEPNDRREFGRVPGVPNVPAIVAAAAALEAVERERQTTEQRLRVLVTRIREQVRASIPDVAVVGDAEDRLAHIVTFSCLYVPGDALLTALDRAGFAVSSGSSCTADVLTPSHVLVAMGALSQGNIRVSLPHDVAETDVDRFLAVLPGIVADLRRDIGATGL